jgi:P22_AR N-terminal domain
LTTENPNPHAPAEQLPITLFDAVVLAVRAEAGTIYLAIRDVCQALAIDFSTQLRRIRNHAVLAEGLARFRIATSGGAQAQDFLELERVPTWLLMINARVGEPVRPRLLWLQRYIVREVYRSFATLAGLPEDASRQIEYLVDLQRFNAAITELADHQESLEARQDASRPARIRRGRPGAICAPRSVRSPNVLPRSSSTSAA